jgi:hypothetical protein
MKRILGYLPFVEHYFDDIVIHSKTIEEHLEYLEIIFIRLLHEEDIRINPDKCVFFQTKISV